MILGITGGVGAGKSTVLSYLKEKYHAKLLMTDQIAASLQAPGQICNIKIREMFGEEVFLEDGFLNRPKLASIVFADAEKLEILNRIVHPAVKAYVKEEVEKTRSSDDKKHLLVIESALLLDDHYEELCDEVWYIYTDPQVREQRLMRDRGYSKEKVHQIMQQQLADEVFRKKCHRTLDNSSSVLEKVYEQIDRGLKAYGFL